MKTDEKKEPLAVKIYYLLTAQADPLTIIQNLSSEGAEEDEIERAFEAAYRQFLEIRKIPTATKYAQALAGYALVATRSFHINDYKTAKSAIDSQVKLLQYLEDQEI